MSQEERYNETAFPSGLVSHPANPASVDSVPSDPLCAVADPLEGFFPPTVFRSENETLCERAHPLGAESCAIWRHRPTDGCILPTAVWTKWAWWNPSAERHFPEAPPPATGRMQ